MRHVGRGGRYVRVADPGWRRPLDPRYAAERGGRWNPPGSFPVLYLCASIEVARANVLSRFEGLPYGVLDLHAARRPELVDTDIPEHSAVDALTHARLRALGLPASYPFDAAGRRVERWTTQPVGQAAWDEGERSIACRSAALPKGQRGEELAWFVRGRADRLRVAGRRDFDAWF